MAVHEGKYAIVQIDVNGTPQQFGEVRSYTLEISSNTIDASTLGTDWKNYLRGQRSWSGTLECFYDPTDAAQAELESLVDTGESVTLTFLDLGNTAGNPRKSGSAVITNVTTNVATEDAIGLSISFQGQGALTIDTVPTTP
jgi:predicted secreted protein